MKSVLLALLTLVLVSLPTLGIAAAAKAPPPPPDMRKLIKSVDLKGSTVTIEYMHSKLEHVYRIDGTTAIKLNNVAGKITDIKPGMEVTDYLERDNDDLDGLTLSGYGAAPAAATPAKPKPKPAPKPKTT